MKTIDLHTHTTFSDGTDTPTQLVLKALNNGLSAMAITDHDTIEGIDEAVSAGKKYGLEIVPGIELSTHYEKKEIHIVGLYIDYKNQSFKDKLTELRNVRSNRNQMICERFNELGIPISYNDIVTTYPDAVITRAHFADYLFNKGYIKSRTEAFERYIGDNGPCYVPRVKLDANHAVKLIKEVGGIPILAHPILYHLGTDAMNSLIEHLKEAGIIGLEAIYSTYSLGDELKMRKLAKKYDLIISGGSDYHGTNKPHIDVGKGRGHLFIPYNVLEKIKELRN